MIIGLDLDGVIFDSEMCFATYAELFDIERNGKGIINREELKAQFRYNWTEDIELEFKQCIVEIEKTAPIMPYAKEVIEKLKNAGHTLIAVTARGHLSDEEIETTEKRLNEEGIVLDKIVYNQTDKLEACKKEKVDIMVEDLYDNVLKLSDNGITCLYFRDLVLKQIESDNVKEVRNWGEIYRVILELQKTIK